MRTYLLRMVRKGLKEQPAQKSLGCERTWPLLAPTEGQLTRARTGIKLKRLSILWAMIRSWDFIFCAKSFKQEKSEPNLNFKKINQDTVWGLDF